MNDERYLVKRLISYHNRKIRHGIMQRSMNLPYYAANGSKKVLLKGGAA